LCRKRWQNRGVPQWAPRGCSQRVPAMGVTERPANGTSQGGVPGLSDVRASTLWAKHGVEPLLDSPERADTVTLSGLLGCMALSCGENGDSFRPDEVPRRPGPAGRASAIYKAKPKGCVTRRICEAVSGSTDSWDGSSAVVASLLLGKRNAKPFKSEHPVEGADMGELAIPIQATKWPARFLSGNPVNAKKPPVIPTLRRVRLYRHWRLSCPRS